MTRIKCSEESIIKKKNTKKKSTKRPNLQGRNNNHHQQLFDGANSSWGIQGTLARRLIREDPRTEWSTEDLDRIKDTEGTSKNNNLQ